MTKGPRLLMTHRNTALLLERARIRVEGARVVYDQVEGDLARTFNIPFANLAVLFLGQGTSLTQSAARLLSEEGVYVAFTGTDGVPLHYGSLTNYQVTKYMHQMYRVSTDHERSFNAAKAALARRADLIMEISGKVRTSIGVTVDESALSEACDMVHTMLSRVEEPANILSLEGGFTKKLYSLYAHNIAEPGFTRVHGAGNRTSRAGIANSRLDQGNYLAYGIAGAALWSLGIPASLSFFHGKTRAGGLVFDIADIFKDAIVLPCAFGTYRSETEFRETLTDLLDDHSALEHCFSFLKFTLEGT